MKTRTCLRRTWKTASRPLVGLRDRFLFSDALRSRWRVRDGARQADESTRPFFIVGSPRSGTTLLRAILLQHPAIFIPPENGALGTMIRTFGAHRRSPWEVTVAAVLEAFSKGYEFAHWNLDLAAVAQTAEALPREERSLARLIDLIYRSYGTRHAPGKSRWGDKTVPGDCAYLGKIMLVFPESRYVHIVRDGRDCVASAMKVGMFRGSPEIAAYGWKDSVTQCRRFGRKMRRQDCYYELRYEDLVTTPGPTVRALADFLGIEATPEMLSYSGARNVEDVKEIAHHENVRRPIFKDSIGKWKLDLPASEAKSIMRIMRHELALFGYE